MADPTTDATPTAPAPGLINQPSAATNATPVPVAPAGSTTTTGAMNAGAGVDSPTAASYTASQGQATAYQVPQSATVASQINDIIASGSPLMQQAQAKANETMNARGLMNSSMGITAGETGLLNAAMPIAQQDAQTYANAATKTGDAVNSMTQFNTGQTNTALGANTTQQNSLTQTRMNNESALQIQALQNKGNLDNIYAQGTVNVQLQQLSDNNKLLLQSSAGAASLYSQALQQMSTISTNPDLDGNQKSQALNNAMQALNDGLHVQSVISGTPNVAGTLTFSQAQANPMTPNAVWPPPNPPPSGGGGFLGL